MILTNITEVSEILGLTRVVVAPQHVFITDETLEGKINGHGTYRGLQAPEKKGTIVLSKHADETTPIHESIHSQFGFDELATKPLTRLISRKVELVRRFPKLKGILQKSVRYKLCGGNCGFPEAHEGKYGERIQHYVLV